jgi:hypothetical protein
MILVLYHFRSHVFKCSTECVSLLHMVWLDAPTEITNFNDVAIFNQNVLWFDISMDQTLFMKIIDSGTNLNEKVKCSIFAQKLFFSDQIEQITFWCILKSKVNCCFVFKRSVKSTNILVIELLLNSDFSYQSFFDLATGKRRFFNLFHSYLYSSRFMFSQLNFSIWTFTQRCFLSLDKF